MPTYARGQIVVEDMVGVYHCIARCVRPAFLCGIDPYTGQDYSHRKEWILDRLRDLAGLFAIDEAAILACSVYVDLNPIRAGLATTPEESAYTSGRDRIRSMPETSTRLTSKDQDSSLETCERPDAWLCELALQETA